MSARVASTASLVLICACTGSLQDPLHPTGSSTLARVDRGDAVVAVNVHEGSISRVQIASGDVEELVVGAEPSRVAPFGDVVLVSLRGERAVAVVDVSGPKMKLVDLIPTGAEPFGVVADERARTAYVAVSQAREVLEIDRELTITRTFPVDGEPRWLALHPSGDALFVVGARGARLTRIDLRTEETEDLDGPQVTRPTGDGEVALVPRFTGDPAITPDGDWLVVPGIHADTTTPVETPDDGEPVSNGYGASGLTIGRINPTATVFPLNRHGEVDANDPTKVVFVGAATGRDVVRSYPTSATADPDGGQVALTMEASDAVVFVDLRPFRGQGESPSAFGDSRCCDETFATDSSGFFDGVPSTGGMYERPIVATSTGARGPDGIAFVARSDARVHAFIDRTVADARFPDLNQALNETSRQGFFASSGVPAIGAGVALAASTLPDDVALGMDLFFNATDNRMVGTGAGVSCSTCHAGGRDDGLTWTFELGVRQTPSLAGTVSETFPVTWTDEVDSVATEAQLTSELRMGGKGLKQHDADAIQAFVDFGRRVEVDDRLDTDAIARGELAFRTAGCDDCHGGPRYTDNQSYPMFGLDAVNTPSLSGVAATAPYLHDGSAATLGQVLTLAVAGQMGDASMLSKQELDDLETYLRSL